MVALKASRCGTWRWDIGDDLVEWDEALSAVYGMAHSQAPGTASEFLEIIHPDDRERVAHTLLACIESGSEVDYEFRALVNGKVRWIHDRGSLVRAADGTPLYMTGASLDVTGRKQAEADKKAALDKQRLLLTELNHRTKNHLQMITGMLGLQAARQKNAAVRADFENAIRRIHTIADLHQRLYRDDGYGQVDMEPYLKGICANLREGLIQKTQITLECDVEPVLLHVDQALPLGLMVNELVTNAIKYAFPDGRHGRIAVRLRVRGDRITLLVSDDGTGFSQNATAATTGIGTRLVRSLSRQIDGRLRRTQKRGTSYHLLFRPTQADGSSED